MRLNEQKKRTSSLRHKGKPFSLNNFIHNKTDINHIHTLHTYITYMHIRQIDKRRISVQKTQGDRWGGGVGGHQ